LKKSGELIKGFPDIWPLSDAPASWNEPWRGLREGIRTMVEFKTKYRNSTFSGEKIELDDKSFDHCTFKDCMVVVEKGETEIANCRIENCKLLLRGNAYTVGKIITLFTGKSPLKVLDFNEPLFEKPA
jgi:hypothetical protein